MEHSDLLLHFIVGWLEDFKENFKFKHMLMLRINSKHQKMMGISDFNPIGGGMEGIGGN